MKNYFLPLRWHRVSILWFAILFLTFFSGRAQAQFFSDNYNEAPDGVVGEPYSFTLVVTDNVNEVPTPFTFSITGGQPPPGLTLSASGTLSGTPTIGIDAFFTVRAESSGGILISGVRIVIFNLLPCIDSLSPTGQVFPASGGSGTVGVLAPSDCDWVAVSNSSLSIVSGSSGTGNGTVSYNVGTNSGAAARQETLTIGERTFTVDQAGTAPLFLLSLTSISSRVTEGSTKKIEHVVSVYSDTTGLPVTITFDTFNTGNWLSLSSTSGVAPFSFNVIVDPTGLSPGSSFFADITVTASGANPSTRVFFVNLFVDAAGNASLAVRPSGLTFSSVLGAAPITKVLTLTNEGGGAADFQVTIRTSSGVPWLIAAVASGSVTLSDAVSLAVTADPSGLSEGTFPGLITITSSATGQTIEIPVTLTVSSVQQILRLSQRGLLFRAIADSGAPPPSQSFAVINNGSGILNWSTGTSILSGNSLTVTPPSGSSDAASGSVPRVTVSVNLASLTPGQYYGQVEITSPEADNSPQAASVVLDVLPAGSDLDPVLQPTGLVFVGIAGGSDPASQTISVSTLKGVSETFTSGRSTADGADWFTQSPATGTATPGQPVEITIQPSIAGLTPGVRQGVLTLSFNDGTVLTVDLVLVVADTSSSQRAPFIARLAGCTPTRLAVVFTLLGNQFAVPAAWPIPIETIVVDDCGDPVTTGSVVLTFSNGDPPLPLQSLQDGRWSGTWQGRNVNSRVTITATATIPGTTFEGTAQRFGGVQSNSAAPQVGEGAVVSAASFASQTPAAPGSLVSIFGVAMADATGAADALPLARQLEGTTVLLGGQTLPLLFSSAGQINAMIPYDIAVNTQHQLVVRRGTASTVPEPVTLALAQPAIFTLNQSGQGQGLVFVATATTSVLADTANPAKAGDVVIIWCSGLGGVDQPVVAGDAAPASPLARTLDEVSVNIGGQNAPVQFAGLSPGFAGLYQVNAVIPEGIQPGDAVEVFLNVAGQTSPLVTIAVQ
ncbi:MAG: hypothetical protein O7A06_06490 [Acidobacteria bacterium]|nr:hypothetical protein [Acidobacteriota bacterium]